MRYNTLIVEPLRDMTVTVLGFIPTLFVTLAILGIGWVVARLLRDLITHFLGAIEFDKLSDKLGLTKVLQTGGIKKKPSVICGCVTYSVFMIMVLMLTLKSIGLTVASTLVDTLFAYIPSVLIGVFVLIIGMYVARFVSAIIYIAAKNTDMPAPRVLSRLSKIAIMVYVTILFLKEIGFVSLFVGVHYTMFIGGVVFALALSFGLAGKDVAGKYLDVLKK